MKSSLFQKRRSANVIANQESFECVVIPLKLSSNTEDLSRKSDIINYGMKESRKAKNSPVLKPQISTSYTARRNSFISLNSEEHRKPIDEYCLPKSSRRERRSLANNSPSKILEKTPLGYRYTDQKISRKFKKSPPLRNSDQNRAKIAPWAFVLGQSIKRYTKTYKALFKRRAKSTINVTLPAPNRRYISNN